MIIRAMTQEDVKQVAAIEKENFSLPWSENAFIDALSMEDNLLIVAEEASKILGYICMYVSFDEGEITNVAVGSMYRQKGIAKELLREIFLRAKEKEMARIVLEVRESNAPARALYKRMGFEELGIRKGFYDMPKEDACILEYQV